MRILLMLLLLANLGFFAWQHWYGEPSGDPFAAGRPVETDSAPRVALVGEAGEESLAAADRQEPGPVAAMPAVDEEGAAEGPPSCARLGPFEDAETAGIARVRLVESGFPAELRETGGQIRSGFWVYLPPLPSRDAAEIIEGELRDKGVHDLFIVGDSEQQNAISLGLFSTPERADQRAAEIGRLGYAPRVAERFRDATVYWVDFLQPPGEILEPEALGVMGVGATLPERRDIPCDEIAVDAGGA